MDAIEYIETTNANIVTIITFIVATYFTLKQWRLKTRVSIRTSFSTQHQRGYFRPYINRIILQNNKDRSETILAIYAQLGRDTYVTLEDLENTPLILQPFETVVRKYNPVNEYYNGMLPIDLIDEFMKHDKISIVLSTSHGRYRCKKFVPNWKPTKWSSQFHKIKSISPNRIIDHSRHDDKTHVIQDSAKFIVRVEYNDNKETFYIDRSGCVFNLNHHINEIDQSILLDEIKIKDYFLKIGFKDVEVIDLDITQNYRNQFNSSSKSKIKPVKLTHESWFDFNILSRVEFISLRFKTILKSKKSKHESSIKSISYKELLLIKALSFIPIIVLFLYVLIMNL